MPVYFIYQLSPGRHALKIGVGEKVNRRKRQLQTGNPDELVAVGWIESETPYVLESELHKWFQAKNIRGEWFELQPADILPLLEREGIYGFVAKSDDAFEIVGYDSDGIAEMAGVWEWADLEHYECCPFCGCMCGLVFQEASQMYHCRSCDELTGFFEPEDEDPNGL